MSAWEQINKRQRNVLDDFKETGDISILENFAFLAECSGYGRVSEAMYKRIRNIKKSPAYKARQASPTPAPVVRVCSCGVELPKHPRNGYKLKCDECSDYGNKSAHAPETCKRESCGAEFIPSHGNQKYCDYKCCELARLERMAHKGGWEFVESRSCAECGEPVARPRRKYCSDVCADSAYLRQRQEIYQRNKNRRNTVTE